MISRCMRDPHKRNHLLKCFGRLLQHEVRSLCSDNTKSILISHATEDMIGFNWSRVIDDAEQVAPTLLYLVRQCMPTLKENNDSLVGLIIAILVKQRRPSASIFQRMLSLLLYSGHCTKM